MPKKCYLLVFLSQKSPNLPIYPQTRSSNYNRETIKKILRSDILRESVIYQDILEEGELSAKLTSIPRLSALGLSAEQIAQALDLEIEQVPQVIEGQN
ncbi:MAG: hypothetical protein ACKPJA_14880 [Microcystis panniformis]